MHGPAWMNFLLLEWQPAAAATTMNSKRRDLGGALKFVAQETLIENKGVHYSRYFRIWVLFGLVFLFRRYERLLLSKKYNIDMYWMGKKLFCVCFGPFPLPCASFWWLRCLLAACKSCKASGLQCFPARRVVSKGMASTWRAVAHLEVYSVPEVIKRAL